MNFDIQLWQQYLFKITNREIETKYAMEFVFIIQSDISNNIPKTSNDHHTIA